MSPVFHVDYGNRADQIEPVELVNLVDVVD